MITTCNNEYISYVFKNHRFIFKRIDIIDKWGVGLTKNYGKVYSSSHKFFYQISSNY